MTDIDGVTQLMPEHPAMVAALEDLYYRSDPDHPDVFLTHSSGNVISLFANGNAIWERPTSEHPKILKMLTKEDQITIWLQLARGNINGLDSLEWQDIEAD